MGFEPQIESIISGLPKARQNLFFSATWPREVKNLAREYLTDPVHLEIGDQDSLNANKAIQQVIRVVRQAEKEEHVSEILVCLFSFRLFFVLFHSLFLTSFLLVSSDFI